jgi:hypothetical protein
MHADGNDQRHGRGLMRRPMRRPVRWLTTAAAVAAAAVLVAAVPSAGHAPLADAAAVPGSSLSVTPQSAVLYTFGQFTVSGTAVQDNEPFGEVMVTFNGVFAMDLEVDGDTGDFGPQTMTVPETDSGASAAQCGSNTVAVIGIEDNPSEDVELASATINLGCAAVSVSPSLVGNQQLPATFQVTPQNFPEPSGFTLTVDGTPQGFTTTPGADLDFTGSPSCGAHQVTLSQPFDEQTISASTSFTVLCPQITLSPASIPLSSEPATVTVTGTQFHANQPVSISLDGTTVGSTVTDEDGGFSVPITAQGLDCAAHQVTAAEQATPGGAAFLFTASASLQVTGCKLSLAIDPTVLDPGQVTNVTGTGFAPGVPVTLTWQQPGGAPLLGGQTITAGADGSIGGFVLVLPGDLTGARQLVATQPGGLKLTASALVEANPMQPVPGGQLVYRQ